MISTDLHKWIKDDHRGILIKSYIYTYKCILFSLTVPTVPGLPYELRHLLYL